MRLIVTILASFLGLIVILLVVWLGAHLFTDSSQWARAIAWLDSGMNDHQRFPMRPVANAPPVFNFQEPSAEMHARYAGAFESIRYAENGRDVDYPLEKLLSQTGTLSFIVVKDDTVLYERYFEGYNHDSTVTSFSIAKSFLSALVGVAIAEGCIGSIGDSVTNYVPELSTRDPRYKNITLRDLLTMSSGIRYEQGFTPWSDDAATYYSPNLRAVALSSPIVEEPSKVFKYNNYNALLVGLVLERTTKCPVARYLEEKIWKPLGMETVGSWSLDSEKDGFEKMESGINGRAIDFAKFGRLFLKNGIWNGRRLIPTAWVDESTGVDMSTALVPYYRYFWWVNAKQKGKHHFFAAGNHGQYIYLIPEQDLLMVRFGRADPGRQFPRIMEALAAAIGDRSGM
jgi:CubicO group peptidase (beta-lactamase class C family)